RRNALFGIARGKHLSMHEHNRLRTELSDAIELMGHDYDWPPALRKLLKPAERPLLEAEVANGQHLVDDEHVGVQVRGDREAQARVHPGGVPLDGGIEKLRDARELDDLVELLIDGAAPHPHQRALKVDVLAAGQILMKTCGHFDERPDAPLNMNR